MTKYLDYEGIKEFLQKIIDAPIVNDPDYLLGVKNDKIVRTLNPDAIVNYKFIGSDAGDSIVTIDGENVTVPANSTIEGICFDITEIVTNNLKEIYIYGDVSTKFCESSLPLNYTLELIHVVYTGKKTIDASNLCYNLHALKTAEIMNLKASSLSACFRNCENLETLESSTWNLSECESLDMFMCISDPYRNDKLKTFDISGWDTSKVTSMRGMFQYCQALTELDVSNWDTSNVTDMSYMFNHCEALTELDVSNWDTSKVTSMCAMFQYCQALTELDVSNWDTSNVTDMSYMFNYCQALTELDVSNWDTSKVTSMYGMFNHCEKITELDVSNWDTSNVTDMSYMFNHCEKITELDVSNWDTSKVTSMYAMFQRVDSLEHIDVSNWNTGNVTDMSFMFGGAIVLKELDLSKWNTSNVTAMQWMFDRCYNIQELDLGNFVMDNVTNIVGMFEGKNSPKPNDSVLRSLKLGNWNLEKCTVLIGSDTSGGEAVDTFAGDVSLSNVEGTITNLRFSLDLSDCPLTRDSALVFINGISNNPVEDSPTLTFSSETKALLTDDDIAIATNKGWTVA